ncbi:unnamed protein product [Angiostrongylus costaricensis]|uniref:DUF1310 family protein n=1 Tax=Angiostrongylus costaricensis TaxID=334426 RepID=A0A0R3PY00_ANGCS|nr:unnamed protein product [Angiostrongylus costaricensis]
MKKHYEMKMRQLQELEMSLMEECVEMENIRNQISTQKIRISDKRVSFFAQENQENYLLFPSIKVIIHFRNESVRTVLKKHSEFLERYMGQKVAAVAPRPANFDSP